MENLAHRIASFPAESIALNKQSVLNAGEMSIVEGLLEESYLFGKSATLTESKSRMNRALKYGLQTYEGEMELVGLLEKLSSD